MPQTGPSPYEELLDLGWRWAERDGSHTPHLVPPHGDAALCFTVLTRGECHPVTTGINEHGCRRCKARARIATQRSAPPMDLPARRHGYPGE